LREYLRLEKKTIRVYDILQQLAIVDEDILERFRIDTIELGRGFALEDRDWVDWRLPDGSPCQVPVWVRPERSQGEWILRSRSGRVISRMPDGALYFEQSYYPFADDAGPKTIPEAIEESAWTSTASPPGPLGDDADGLLKLAEGARRLRGESSRAILGSFGGKLLEMGQALYRNDNLFVLLASEPKRAHDFLDRILEIHLVKLEKFLGAVGTHIDLVVFSDDLGMQTGPQISPAMYREFFKPRHSLLCGRAKELAKVKVMLHCCGGIRELIPDLIEAGLDAINPVQISCSGMDARKLKAEFGKDVVFWGGGCNTQKVLPYGTPATVKRHVKEQTAVLSRGGGFVFQQVHNIMANVPPENIVAMFDAINEIS
jgi:uroporphyrinogen decarboxylase